MTKVRVLIVAILLAMPALAAAQAAKQTSLENTLWDVDQQWLCDGPYQKPYAECMKFRSKYWLDGFFEVQSGGHAAQQGRDGSHAGGGKSRDRRAALSRRFQADGCLRGRRAGNRSH